MLKQIAAALMLGFMIQGCATYESAEAYGSGALYGDALAVDAALEADGVPSDRMLIWTGSMTIEVLSISNAAAVVTGRAKELGGYVESSSRADYGRPSAQLKLRVPSDQLKTLLDSMEGLGEVTEKKLASTDVTDAYIDVQARLGTKKKLRDRLQKLLDRADEVQDVLAIERELTRLQADIDSMTARLKAMKGKVDYATLSVRLNAARHEKVLGPLGYAWKGCEWAVTKLFVWKDESYEEQ